MKRSEAREAAFILTFEKMFTDESTDYVIECARETDEFQINDGAERMFKAALEHYEEADKIISGYSEKRQISRIPKVSLAILRIAIYEIIYDERVPYNVAVSEAVILAKKYAYESDVQFINGVLGAFVRDYEKEHKKEVSDQEKDGAE